LLTRGGLSSAGLYEQRAEADIAITVGFIHRAAEARAEMETSIIPVPGLPGLSGLLGLLGLSGLLPFEA